MPYQSVSAKRIEGCGSWKSHFEPMPLFLTFQLGTLSCVKPKLTCLGLQTVGVLLPPHSPASNRLLSKAKAFFWSPKFTAQGVPPTPNPTGLNVSKFHTRLPATSCIPTTSPKRC